MFVRVPVYEPSKYPFEYPATSVRITPSSTHIRLLVDGSTKARFHQLLIAQAKLIDKIKLNSMDIEG